MPWNNRPFTYHSYFSPFLFVIILIGNSPSFAQTNFENDIVYDTVWVYDTVYEYETIYDTVWEYETVYDTVVIDAPRDPYAMIEPIDISELHFSTNYYKAKTYPKVERPKQRKPTKRTVFGKLRYKFKNNRDQFKSWDMGTENTMTLNPVKGTFNPKVFLKGTYSLDAYGGLAFQSTTYSNKLSDDNGVNNQDSINELPTYEYGMRLNFNLFQYGAQTGIGMSQIRDEFSYIDKSYNVDSTAYKEPNHYWNTEIRQDSAQNMDSLLQGVEYWEKFEYPVDVYIKDSLTLYNYDTTWYSERKTVINTIALIEVPLIFTYELAFSRLSMQFKLGGINQIQTYAKGYLYNGQGEVQDIQDVMTFTRYNLALYGGLGFIYKFSYDFSMVLDTYYKYPLFKFSESNSTIVRRQSFGINAGLRYSF